MSVDFVAELKRVQAIGGFKSLDPTLTGCPFSARQAKLGIRKAGFLGDLTYENGPNIIEIRKEYLPRPVIKSLRDTFNAAFDLYLRKEALPIWLKELLMQPFEQADIIKNFQIPWLNNDGALDLPNASFKFNAELRRHHRNGDRDMGIFTLEEITTYKKFACEFPEIAATFILYHRLLCSYTSKLEAALSQLDMPAGADDEKGNAKKAIKSLHTQIVDATNIFVALLPAVYLFQYVKQGHEIRQPEALPADFADAASFVSKAGAFATRMPQISDAPEAEANFLCPVVGTIMRHMGVGMCPHHLHSKTANTSLIYACYQAVRANPENLLIRQIMAVMNFKPDERPPNRFTVLDPPQ